MRITPLLVVSSLVVEVCLSSGQARADESSIHARDAEQQPVPLHSARRRLPPPRSGAHFKSWVYGYLPSWIGASDHIAWDKLSHVAIFNVGLASDGGLTSVSTWNKLAPKAMTLGAPYGVRVHLAIACFDKAVMNAVLPDAARRQKMVSALGDLVDAQGAHGVSVDFEFMPVAHRDHFTTLIKELKQRVGEVTVATPAVDWAHAYDYGKLAEAADALFIMGYDYHWSTGNPGPVAPLKGGVNWNVHALEWTLADYLAAGAPREKLVLGLPLYGYRWPTASNAVPGTATGAATAVLMADAMVETSSFSAHFDDETQTPYYFPAATKQVFYDDTSSLTTKIGWAVGQGIEGIGFWALGYDGGDPSFWSMVGDFTQTATEGEGCEGGGGAGPGPGGAGGSGSGPLDPPGGGGSAATAGGAGDTAAAAPGGADDLPPAGCACATGPRAPLGPAPWGSVLLALVAWGRKAARRRRGGPSDKLTRRA